MWKCPYCSLKTSPCGAFWEHLEKVHPESPEVQTVRKLAPKN